MSKVTNSEFMRDQAALESWQAEQSRPGKSQTDAMIEAAARDPIGFQILARRVVYDESYERAVEHLSTVTTEKLSNGAARVRVCRLTRSIRDAIIG